MRDPRGTRIPGTEIGVRAWIAKPPSRNATLAGAGMTSACRVMGSAVAVKQPKRKATAEITLNNRA